MLNVCMLIILQWGDILILLHDTCKQMLLNPTAA